MTNGKREAEFDLEKKKKKKVKVNKDSDASDFEDLLEFDKQMRSSES